MIANALPSRSAVGYYRYSVVAAPMGIRAERAAEASSSAVE
jgi:hypothetical protein